MRTIAAFIFAGITCLGMSSGLSGCGGEAPAATSPAPVQEKTFFAPPVTGERIDPAEYDALLQESRLRGAVRVAVSLEPVNVLSAESPANALARATASRKLAELLVQLGPQVWLHTAFEDQTFMGMATMYVTAAGLEVLTRSDQVRMFFRTSNGSRMVDSSASLEAIDQALLDNAAVDIDLALNIDALDCTYGRDRRFSFLPSAEQSQQVQAVRARLLASLVPEHVVGWYGLLNAAWADSPMLSLRITRAGFYALRASSDVLSMRPTGWVDDRQALIDQVRPGEAWGVNGDQVEVMLGLRDIPGLGIVNSNEAQKRQNESLRRTFDDILQPLQGQVIFRQRETESLGYAAVVLTPAGYARLITSPDPRLVAVSLNRPCCTVAVGS